jgi:carbamoyl-phosphate synthase large subunit
MKSVGEVMAIGRTFQESFQKALRGLEIGVDGLNQRTRDRETIEKELGEPGPERIWYVGDAFENGFTLEEVYRLTKIDPWFLDQIQEIVELEMELDDRRLGDISRETLWELKRKGFSDRRLAYLFNTDEKAVRARRHELGIRPVYKRVDTCAAEFATKTAYMYSTYEEEDESAPTGRKKIMVLGGGPNRIGQGIEFDYCCVHAALALRADGFETIMVNCNPETVSTDYDTSDRLYFEPLTLEDVLEIVEKEKPWGVIVQYGGQTPLKLSRDLAAAGVPIIGTSAEAIDIAEDRERFQKLVDKLKLRQPPNRTARSTSEAVKSAEEIGYPVVVRPSYVLGGRAMEIVHQKADLERYMREAVKVSNDSPVLLDRYLTDAIEVDVDCICDKDGNVLIGGIMEHVEQAGVHSGDSACCLPPHSLASHVERELKRQTALMARALKVVGLMNVQYAIQRDTVYVLEVNPRASRTVPYVSKATGQPLAMIAARCMAGKTLREQGAEEVTPWYFSVKEAVFPFARFPGVDTILGPEMKSTGEVMGVGRTFGEAFVKSQLAAGVRLPTGGRAFISVRDGDKLQAVEVARDLSELGFSLLATRGTAGVLMSHGIPVTQVNKVAEGRPHIVDMMKNGDVNFIVNTTEATRTAHSDSRAIRVTALARRITYYTTIAGAKAACAGMKQQQTGGLEPYRLQDLHERLKQAPAEPVTT